MHHAIRALRISALPGSYAEAWSDWLSDGEADAWDNTPAFPANKLGAFLRLRWLASEGTGEITEQQVNALDIAKIEDYGLSEAQRQR